MRWPLALGPVLLAACSASGVTATHSSRLPPPFERGTVLAPVSAVPTPAALEWGSCDGAGAPWECTTLRVPLDYRRPTESGTVDVAVTRLRARGQRLGSLVVNPGGPGGSGTDLAWNYADQFPAELTDRFDLVGFDPRGVGRSTAVDCGDLDRSFVVVELDCIAHSGDLLPYVGTQNSARDVESLRIALGDDRLTFLGFSYGTTLGAAYAVLFPGRVRALVLDGSTDPAAGMFNIDGTTAGSWGTPFYGVQDFGGTVEVFFDLCDATNDCKAGPNSRRLLDALYDTIGEARTDYFAGWDETVTPQQVDGIITSAMYNTDLWTPLAVGLDDAANGDASTLAALGSFLEAGYPRVENPTDNLLEANLAVYCADFAGRSGSTAVDNCRGWPETAEPLAPVTRVDVATPIVVIGTDGDPATPGFLAPRMATALGDAVSVRWQGAGHTAFLHSACIDTIVVDYLVDLTVPADRSRCGFTDGVNTTVARAEQVFRSDRDHAADRLASVFVAEGSSRPGAACLARHFAEHASPSVLVYARLGVRNADYVAERADAEAACGLAASAA